ncbi:hypothetical protein RHECNPAF_6420013 [Rhizobium etli CNPAF512]|nr:hypothetical protein RHECNPAF_6420013 [Rhizobium etli CNPAF512]
MKNLQFFLLWGSYSSCRQLVLGAGYFRTSILQGYFLTAGPVAVCEFRRNEKVSSHVLRHHRRHRHCRWHPAAGKYRLPHRSFPHGNPGPGG